jgi:outer membrane protein assembly factor BamB
MTGVSPKGDPPIEWSEQKNLRWKVAIPGRGSATPIIWEDRIYVLTAVPVGHQPRQDVSWSRNRGVETPTEQEFVVLALSREDGSVVWRQAPRREVPHEGKQQNNSYASASAVTDGTHLFAHFGSRGLYCYDMNGTLQWEKDLGDMRTRNSYGEGSTPALSGNTLVVNWDHLGQSFIVAFDKNSGKELWRANRDEVTSWATPLIVEHGGRKQVITTGTNRVRSYDLATGEMVWEGPGLTLNSIPSPVESDGVVYVTAGFRGSAAWAIRLSDAKGDIEGTAAVVWEHHRDTPYIPSPLLYGDNLYLIKSNSGILSSFNAPTGQKHYGPLRLEGISEIYASPVGAGGRVYIIGRDGNALVIEDSTDYKILAKNSLEDGFDASPAIVDSEMYLRGYRYLYRISED